MFLFAFSGPITPVSFSCCCWGVVWCVWLCSFNLAFYFCCREASQQFFVDQFSLSQEEQEDEEGQQQQQRQHPAQFNPQHHNNNNKNSNKIDSNSNVNSKHQQQQHIGGGSGDDGGDVAESELAGELSDDASYLINLPQMDGLVDTREQQQQQQLQDNKYSLNNNNSNSNEEGDSVHGLGVQEDVEVAPNRVHFCFFLVLPSLLSSSL